MQNRIDLTTTKMNGEHERSKLDVGPCSFCQEVGVTHRCSTCLTRAYCSMQCQRKDWRSKHRDECEKLRRRKIYTDAATQMWTDDMFDDQLPGASLANLLHSVLGPEACRPLRDASCCAACGGAKANPKKELLVCERCRGDGYCNKACQKAHWRVHKPKCKTHEERLAMLLEMLSSTEVQTKPDVQSASASAAEPGSRERKSLMDRGCTVEAADLALQATGGRLEAARMIILTSISTGGYAIETSAGLCACMKFLFGTHLIPQHFERLEVAFSPSAREFIAKRKVEVAEKIAETRRGMLKVYQLCDDLFSNFTR